MARVRGGWRWLGPALAFVVVVVVVVVGGSLLGRPADSRVRARDSAPEPMPPPVTRVVMAGDSIMFTFMFNARFEARTHIEARAWAPIGCGLVNAEWVERSGKPRAECTQWPAVWARFGRDFRPDAFVYETGRWDVADKVLRGVPLTPGRAAFDAAFTASLEQARTIAEGARAVFAILDLPCLPDVPADRRDAFNRMLRAYVVAHPSVRLVPWSDLLCPGGRPATSGGRPLRFDGIHFDGVSAPVVADWLAPRLRDLRRPPRGGPR